MARSSKEIPITAGAGELRFSGFCGPVLYEIMGEPSGLKPSGGQVRGSITASPEVAERAFRHGEGLLTLDTGARFRLTMLGYSAGSDRTYFEMRV